MSLVYVLIVVFLIALAIGWGLRVARGRREDRLSGSGRALAGSTTTDSMRAFTLSPAGGQGYEVKHVLARRHG